MARYYCLLHIRSNNENTGDDIFTPDVIDFLEFDDLRSKKNLEKMKKWRDSSIEFIVRNDLPRYVWTLSSLEEIDDSEWDLFIHISWLLSTLNQGVSLSAIQKNGIECELSFFWGGNGTGGGPTIPPRLSELLNFHKIKLDIRFYYED